MLLGMSAFAQSGWTNPSGNYQLETVVYAVVDCGNYGLYGSDVLPEVAAFVNGELRAVASEYRQNDAPAGEPTRVYTLRVGGEASDNGEAISFKLYDPSSGLIYPLEVKGGATITWTGDNTAVYPSNYYTLTASVAVRAIIYNDEGKESPSISMRVGDKISLDGYYVRFYDIDGKEVVSVESEGVWTIGGPNAPYVSQVSDSEGSVIVQGIAETPDNDGDDTPDYMDYCINYSVGNFAFNIPVQVLEEYIPVTSIAVEDYNYYWPGYGRLPLDNIVIYNNNQSVPTNPGVIVVSSSNTDVVEVMNNILVFNKMGNSVITIKAVDNEEITTTFNVNILSALSSMATGFENDTYEYQRQTGEEEEIKFPMPQFNWVTNEDGLPVIGNDINEEFRMVSDNPEVLRIDDVSDETASYQRVVSLKKGTANVTCTSVYDPEKSVTYKVVVTQGVNSVNITSIDGAVIDEGGETMPEVDVIVGKTVTAMATVNPADADYENFTMQFVNANWGEIEGFEECVEIIGSTVIDGTCIFQFKFKSVPQETYNLQAVIDMDYLSRLVRLNVIQKVETITLDATEKTLWINADETQQFNIDVKIEPDNATDKRYTVESSNGDVVSVELVNDGETESSYNFYAIGKGEATLTFRSVDNPDAVATCFVTVKRRVSSIGIENLPSELYNDGEVCNAALVYFPSDADIDVEALSYEIRTNGPSASAWSLIDITLLDAGEGTIGLEVIPRSLCSDVSIVFSYDKSVEGESMNYLETTAQTSVCEKISLGEGWSWISLISADYSLDNLSEVLVEARSKSELVYNDPAWGLFGSLSTLGTNEAYKVNIKEGAKAYDICLTSGQILSSDGTIDDKAFVKGWNWVSYPYEYSYPIGDIFTASAFNEGDIILSKSGGFATLTSGSWEGTLETLTPGEGYMVYCNNAQGFTLSMPGRYSLEQGYFTGNGAAGAAAIERSVWNYDHSRFANTMAVIAKIDVEDCSSYTIGAFVGDECRGEGEFINGKAYISVVGEMGEIITFRLYDRWTGEYIDVTGEITFADKVGTPKEPVLMGVADGTTDIVDINSIDSNNVEAIYDAAGRAVSEMTEGIYILKVREGDRVVTKKVRK